MKTIQRFIGILLALLMLTALLIPVSAAETHSLTINSAKTDHTYEAYAIFSGEYYDGKLSNIEWGGGVNSTTLLPALKALAADTTLGTAFAACADAADVAEVLDTFADDSDKIDAFAEIVGAHLGTKVAADFVEDGSVPNITYTLDGLADGYYFVKDADDSVTADGDAYTKYILKVLGEDVNVDVKADAPTLEKKIVGDELTCTETAEGHTHTTACYARVDANNAAIGDTVKFEIKAPIPEMDGYNKYIFNISDTLSQGLTFDAESLAVSVAGTAVEKSAYTLKQDATTNSFTVVFANFLQYKGTTGDVVVTYNATLNSNAVVGTTGNTNQAQLIYSNDPQHTYTGDEPTTDDPTGKTPWDTTVTYSTGLKLIKYTMDGTTEKNLAGAVFQVTGTKLNKVRVTGERFVVDNENGTWYKLANGTYTQEEVEGYTGDMYKPQAVSATVVEKEEVNTALAVGANGELVLDGLAEGEYTIKELVAPNGYNLLEEPITITITWTAPTAVNDTAAACTWSATAKVGNGEATSLGEAATFQYKVLNQAGPTLPSTGGIGTRIFYIVGGALLLGALVLLLVKVLADRKQSEN